MLDLTRPTWLGKRWSSWQQMGKSDLSVPDEPGLYCFRTVLSNTDAEDRAVIAYIGETHDLGQRVCGDWKGDMENTVDPFYVEDRRLSFLAQWKDYPHQFEVSFCTDKMVTAHPLATESYRKAAEKLAKWRCRVETGRSAAANHQRASYATGDLRDGGHCSGDVAPSMPPRKNNTFPADPKWMGLNWTRFGFCAELKPSRAARPDQEMHDASLDRAGVFKILDPDTLSVLKIGFRNPIGKGLRSELSDLCTVMGKEPLGSWAHVPPDMPRYCYIEVRDDLIGAYYYQIGKPPVYQFTDVSE